MMKAACHCGVVRFEITERPSWVLNCDCVLCRRYGALWSYYHGADQANLLKKPRPDTTFVYSWNDRNLAFHYCKFCGCITHFEAIKVNSAGSRGCECANDGRARSRCVRLRQIDNGHTDFFWTKSDEPEIPSRHPPMPGPGQPFNPLTEPAPEFDQLPSNRQPGGLGLHLVRNLIDEAHYTRRNGRNIVRLT